MEIVSLLKNCDIREVHGELKGDVSVVCYDSKLCGGNSLFVAVPGLAQDGHTFIPDALSRGARFIIHEKENETEGAVTIRVRDSRRALGIIGKNFYGDPSSLLCLIGVVGTNGKTTVTYLLESILRQAGLSAGVLGTVNYRFCDTVLPAPNTTPESIDLQKILRKMVDEGVTHVAAEVSSHAIDLHRVDDCSFAIGIFTNLTQDHLDYHGTMENYFQAKKRFFTEILPSGKSGAPLMIINGDDLWGQRLQKEVGATVPSLTFGIGEGRDVMAEEFDLSTRGIRAVVRTPEKRILISSSLFGTFNLSNILAAVATATALGLPEEAIREGIVRLKNVPGRLEKVGILRPGGPHVFVDYAHTEDALRKALQNLLEFKEGKIITVFGCGGDRDRGKRPLMGQAAAALSDLVIITSDNPRSEDPLAIIGDIEAGLQASGAKKVPPEGLAGNPGGKSYTIIPDRRRAIAAAISAAGSSDTVLIAGKGHEDYQIIGSSRIPFDDRKIAQDIIEQGLTESGLYQ